MIPINSDTDTDKYNVQDVEETKGERKTETLCTLAPKPPCEGKILGLDGHTLSVDGGKVGVFEKGDEVSLGGLLESHDGGGLETEVRLWQCRLRMDAYIDAE